MGAKEAIGIAVLDQGSNESLPKTFPYQEIFEVISKSPDDVCGERGKGNWVEKAIARGPHFGERSPLAKCSVWWMGQWGQRGFYCSSQGTVPEEFSGLLSDEGGGRQKQAASLRHPLPGPPTGCREAHWTREGLPLAGYPQGNGPAPQFTSILRS